MAACGIRNPRVEAAFAAVAREDFLGPGPWQIVRCGGGYRATPDPDPVYLYEIHNNMTDAVGSRAGDGHGAAAGALAQF